MPEIPLIQDKKKNLYEIIQDNILRANTTKEQGKLKTLVYAGSKLNNKIIGSRFSCFDRKKGC